MAARDAALGASSSIPDESDSEPLTIPPLPYLNQIETAIRVWMFKIVIYLALGCLNIYHIVTFSTNVPNYAKRYSVRPSLKSRVFLPKNYKKGEKLPLYIDIHGGGFAICDPSTDDHYCRHFADEFGFCVVSIAYRKGPLHRFPIPVHDCAELTRAVLADKELPVDHDKVVLGGFSAGGNLSLAVAQFDDIKPRLKGVIPIYPVTDFTQKCPREYKVTKEGKEDMLKNSSRLFDWAYVTPGTNRRNTFLSCVYATRSMLPQKMYFVGAEYDCLCNEANAMAKRLAGIENEPDLGPAWSKNGIRWEMVADQQHGFTHVRESGNKEIARQKVCKDLYKRIASWIKEEVFPN